MLKPAPPTIPGSAMFKSMQSDLAKIEELLGDAVSENGWKGSVKVTTTVNITLSAAQTIDDVAIIEGDLVLVKNQSTGSQNGIYVCKTDAWERSERMLIDTVASGSAIYVLEGTVGSDKLYICTDLPAASVVGTDALTFEIFTSGPAGSDTQVQFNDAGVMAGDTGLTFDKTTNVLTAGLSGSAGSFVSYPSTAANGTLSLVSTNAGGAFNTIISNGIMTQTTVYTIPNVSNGVGRFLVAANATPFVIGNLIKSNTVGGLMVDGGYKILSGTTATYGGGGTSNAFVATGLTTSYIVTANILTSTNVVGIAKAVPTANTLTITFTADPGAGTTINWVATSTSAS